MAEKRMFSKKIIDSDAFLDMPLSTQALYFHLSMRADDEGFINNPKKISRMIGCCEDDLKLLIAKKFIIPFESGVVVIKHWLIHNTIRKDRIKETLYKKEKQQIGIKENGSYTTQNLIENNENLGCQPNDNQMTDNCQPTDSIDKIRLEEIRLEEISINTHDESPVEETKTPKKLAKTKKEEPVKHKYGEYQHVMLSDDEKEKLLDCFANDKEIFDAYEFLDAVIKFFDEYIEEKGYKSKSHYLAIKRWVIPAVKKQATKQQTYNRKSNNDDLAF